MRIRLDISLWLALALFKAQSIGQTVLEEFPFRFSEGFIWVQVCVPQSERPLNFLLDSGAQVSAINLRTAERLGLKLGNRVTVQGLGASSSGYWAQQLQATTAGVPLPRKYLAVDLGQLSDACQCRIDGLIGADFFLGRTVRIDFARQRVQVLARPVQCSGAEALPLEVRHGALRVPVRVNDDPSRWVRLDTGCASSLHWVSGKAAKEGGATRLAVALSKVHVPVIQTTVQLGGSRFYAVPTDLHEKPIFAEEVGLLGNGLLSRFDAVTIDAKSGRVWLFRSGEAAPPGSHG